MDRVNFIKIRVFFIKLTLALYGYKCFSTELLRNLANQSINQLILKEADEKPGKMTKN